MTQIEQLLSDVRTLRHWCSPETSTGKAIVEEYLLANQHIIKSFLNVAYQEHTREERFAFQIADLQLDASGLTDGFHEIALTALKKLSDKAKGFVYSEVSDDDLNMLHRGLKFACKFASKVQGQLRHSPVS